MHSLVVDWRSKKSGMPGKRPWAPSKVSSKSKITNLRKNYSEFLGFKLKAKIKRIGSVIDPSSETVKIEAEIENKNHELKPGMTGIASFNNNPTSPISNETNKNTKEPIPTNTLEIDKSQIKDKQEDSKKHSKDYPENIEKKSWNFFNTIIMSSIK